MTLLKRYIQLLKGPSEIEGAIHIKETLDSSMVRFATFCVVAVIIIISV